MRRRAFPTWGTTEPLPTPRCERPFRVKPTDTHRDNDRSAAAAGDDVVLVTGAAGFIGSHVCEAFLERGAAVVGLDNLDGFYSPHRKRQTIEDVRVAARDRGARFDFVELDIRQRAELVQLFNTVKPAGVVHLAARAGVRPSIAEPALYAEVNVAGTANLLEASREAGSPTRFVCASSSSVYGNNEKVPFAETDPVEHPISPYAATKRACELIGHTHHHLHGLPIAMLRFFTVFGPRQRPDLAIAKFIDLIERGQTIPMFGDGSTSRDYTFIDDIVRGVLAAYDRIANHGYRIWNLGGSRPTTLRDMIDTIAAVVGEPARVEPQPMQPGDVERTYADIARAADELGYAPQTSFETGVRRQYEWLRAYRELARA